MKKVFAVLLISCFLCCCIRDYIFAVTDTEAPTIKSITVDKHEVSAGDTVTVKVMATDESGIKYGSDSLYIGFKKPDTSDYYYIYLDHQHDDEYTGTVYITEDMISGEYIYRTCYIEDTLGNGWNYGTHSFDTSEIYFYVYEDQDYFSISAIDGVYVFNNSVVVEGKEFYGDVYIGRNSEVSMRDCVVHGNIFVIGKLWLNSIVAEGLYAYRMEFGTSTSTDEGTVYIRGENDVSFTQSGARPITEIPYRLDIVKSKGGLLSIKGAVADVTYFYINDTRVNLVNNKLLIKDLHIDDAETIKLRWATPFGYSITRTVNVDIEPLTAPTVTISRNNGKGILVKWDEVEGATGYVVYRRAMKSGETNWTAFARWSNTTELSFLDTKVYEGTKYQYGIKAYYGDDPQTTTKLGPVGPMSTAVIYSKKPEVPTKTTTKNTGDGIEITWDAVKGATGYVIYRRAWSSTTNGWTEFQRWNNTTSTTWTDTKVYAGTKYQYGIKAYYGDDPKNMTYVGSVGPLSTNVRITTRKITSLTASGSKVTVKWDASNVFTGYQVQYADNASFSGATLKTVSDPKTATLTVSLGAGKTYYFRVRSYYVYNDIKYYGAWSEAKSIMV